MGSVSETNSPSPNLELAFHTMRPEFRMLQTCCTESARVLSGTVIQVRQERETLAEINILF